MTMTNSNRPSPPRVVTERDDHLKHEQHPMILVHADGGDWHGSPVVHGSCVGCGISPDTQSCELWPASEAVHEPSTRVCLNLFELQHLADFAGNVDDADHRAEWDRLTNKLEAAIVRLGARPISRNSTR